MGAGPSPAQVQAAQRRALASAVKRFGGTTVRNTVQFKQDGVQWMATTSLIRASNGEAALVYHLINVDSNQQWKGVGTWEHLAMLAGVTVTSGA